MKKASLKELKDALKASSPEELTELCVRLARQKVENKELLTYLIFYNEDEESYINSVKQEIQVLFSEINTANYYLIKKGVRKILRQLKKYIRFSKNKETEAELLLFFCEQLKQFSPNIKGSIQLVNIYYKQLELAGKAIDKLHEDLQYDFHESVEKLAKF